MTARVLVALLPLLLLLLSHYVCCCYYREMDFAPRRSSPDDRTLSATFKIILVDPNVVCFIRSLAVKKLHNLNTVHRDCALYGRFEINAAKWPRVAPSSGGRRLLGRHAHLWSGRGRVSGPAAKAVAPRAARIGGQLCCALPCAVRRTTTATSAAQNAQHRSEKAVG